MVLNWFQVNDYICMKLAIILQDFQGVEYTLKYTVILWNIQLN